MRSAATTPRMVGRRRACAAGERADRLRPDPHLAAVGGQHLRRRVLGGDEDAGKPDGAGNALDRRDRKPQPQVGRRRLGAGSAQHHEPFKRLADFLSWRAHVGQRAAVLGHPQEDVFQKRDRRRRGAWVRARGRLRHRLEALLHFGRATTQPRSSTAPAPSATSRRRRAWRPVAPGRAGRPGCPAARKQRLQHLLRLGVVFRRRPGVPLPAPARRPPWCRLARARRPCASARWTSRRFPRRLSASASNRCMCPAPVRMCGASGVTSAALVRCGIAASISCCRSSSRPRFAQPAGSWGTSAVTRSSDWRARTSWLVCIAARPV